ncbi:MAG TPA: VIT1/CCC1 transporter family protein [Vicinamibacterales bacterium]
MPRISHHVEPIGPREVFRHYIRDLVYGANDGIITTFAVVAGVTGGDLTIRAIIVVGVANLFADGLSMGVGNYLAIRSEEGARAAQGLPELEGSPARHGTATFLAFAIAGAIPLLPYFFDVGGFTACIVLTLLSLFTVGALRTLVTLDRWWVAGLEMLGLGVVVAFAAYYSGAGVAWLLG